MEFDARLLPIRSLKPDPINPRDDLGDMTAFTLDIKEAGIIEPLVVRPGSWGKPTGECQDCEGLVERRTTGLLVEHTADGIPCPGGSAPAADDWYVVAGHRRLAGAVAAGLRDVPCAVHWDLKTKADVLLFMVRENTHRRNLTAVEEASAYKQLMLEGMTEVRIAQQTHLKTEHVRRRVKLLSLSEKALDDVRRGIVTLADAEALLGLTPDAEANALKSIGTRDFKQEVAREHLKLVGDATDENVAQKLRDDFISPYLAGTTRPADERPVMREIIGVLAANLPRRVASEWAKRLGVTDPGALSTVQPMSALLGLAVTVEKTTNVYPLLTTLGYAPSPLEEQLLEGA